MQRGDGSRYLNFPFLWKDRKVWGTALNTEQVREGSKLLHRHTSACVAGLLGGDPQKQFFSKVSATVGQRVVLPCQSTTKDSDSTLNFFWYRQLPGDTLKFLMEVFRASGNDKFHNGKFSVVVYENKTAPLEIATVSFQDTAIYYCAPKHHIKLSPISAHAKSASPRMAQEG